jgi:ribosome modulation factor
MYNHNSDEYWDGYNAYLSGAKRADNPYVNPRLSQDWKDGWQTAYND